MELNKIYMDDAISKMQEMKSESVDLVVTDPPYKTVTGGDSDGKNSIRPKGMLRGNRKLFKHQRLKISEWMEGIFKVLKEGSHCYIFTNSLNMEEMLSESREAGFKLHNILIWKKNNMTPSQYYMKNCEYILLLRKGKAKYINNIGSSHTVHEFNNITRKKLHPTEKPINLLEFYISNSSEENDIVFDPFMGSGSTALACLNTNRNYIGFELDEEYYNVANERIKDYTIV